MPKRPPTTGEPSASTANDPPTATSARARASRIQPRCRATLRGSANSEAKAAGLLILQAWRAAPHSFASRDPALENLLEGLVEVLCDRPVGIVASHLRQVAYINDMVSFTV